MLISNISKLFKYKWGGEFFSKLKPTQNEIMVPDGVKKSIKAGTGLMLIYICISALVTILTTVLITSAFGYLRGYGGFGLNVGIIISALITLLISAAIIITLMVYLTGNKKRKPMPYFIVLILAGIGIFFMIWGIISAIAMIGYTAIFGLISLIGVLVEFVALCSIAVGCIDFCLAANSAEPQKTE